jgi:hypothetical protein
MAAGADNLAVLLKVEGLAAATVDTVSRASGNRTAGLHRRTVVCSALLENMLTDMAAAGCTRY